MYAKESLKRTFERVTGIGRPKPREARTSVRPRKAQATRFKDDGLIPNNPTLPFIRYRGVVALKDAADPAAVFEVLFEANGWGGSWRNGIYDYVHYHPRIHEVLGIARGRARVRFGGSKGKVVPLKAGDVAILPAGTGHQALSASKDLLVVGAYPARGQYDEYEGSEQERARRRLYDSKGASPADRPGVWPARAGACALAQAPRLTYRGRSDRLIRVTTESHWRFSRAGYRRSMQ